MSQQARADRIRQMFDQIADGYDRRNRLFSLDRDTGWRRAAARMTALRPGDVALDLCCGTGKLAHELLPMVRPGGRVIGIDFSERMLEIARRLEPGIEFDLGDASNLPYPDGSVAAVTIGFGLRNLVAREAGLKEMFRALGPGGRLVVLELPPPPRGPLRVPYSFYLTRVMPAVAGALKQGEDSAYRYLSESVRAFPRPPELAAELRAVGFDPVKVKRLSFGIAVVHVGIKPT
ncbi:MAG TPA: bifunctional demethylmenaquinone methyltransferase/2-methoxy-6-polyprenyl-1,4-benzoquinol methylase UbiE [Candidatus Dormibacteraeota bacterium]